MTDHQPPPPRLLDLRTTTQILNQTTTIVSTRHHLRIFLILSFLLFSLRTNVGNLTHFITTHIDNNPEIETLLSRIKPPPNPHSPTTTSLRLRHRRHRPLSQLTRFGILEDDYFSEYDEFDNRFLGKSSKLPQLNVTSFILDSFNSQLGVSGFIFDNGIRVSKIVRSIGTTSFRSIEIVQKEENAIINNADPALIEDEKTDGKSKTDLGFFSRFDLENQESNTLLTLIGVIAGSYGAMILAYVFIHVLVHGVVFLVVVNDFLKRFSHFRQTFQLGVNLGSRRLAWLVILRWVVRDVMSRILGGLFFGEIVDPSSRLKIFVRLMFMPFSAVSPWVVKGFEKEVYGFLLSWFLLDMLVSFVLALATWVAMVDSGRTGMEVIEEAWHLLLLMYNPAINLKCLEGFACGSFARLILTHMFGKVLASMIQCSVEVYFMVAWMMHYLSVKSMDAEVNGVPFGNRELEAMLEVDR